MSFDVKTTTIRKLLEAVCPHYCMGCGELGEILCGRCRNDNGYGEMDVCLNCGVMTRNGVCDRCNGLSFDRGFAVGKRDGLLEKCINEFKYSSVRALHVPLAQMLSAALPCLPDGVVVVPIPTNSKHIRKRGLDHTALLAKELARLRGWEYEKTVVRVKDSVQVGAEAKVRRKQAEEAYGLGGRIRENVTYVVVDDVWTTGATMNAVCKILKQKGAKNIVAIVLARA